MATYQTKHHGTVAEFKVRSKAEARESARSRTENACKQGYTLVGSAPGLTMLVCKEHANGLPADADFCYIISTP